MDSPAGTALSPHRGRIESLDLLRGLVIVLMALDHARDYFGPTAFVPENLDQASPALFLTRWVTHLCAPVFVFLAGLGADLYRARRARRESRAEVSRFLWTRGLWLIVLELTVINLSWLSFVVGGYLFVQVIWAIGVSMIVLAGLVWLPRWAIAAFAVAMIAGHGLLDGISPRDLAAPWSHLWGILHARHWIPTGDGFGIIVIYPLIPWPAVMALGYLCGSLYRQNDATRRRWLLGLGAAATAGFVLLRLVNGYGDPSPWEPQERGALFTALDFFNTTKYPASLLFLLMTLGPALLLLPALEKARGSLARILITFGRVPLFFYVIHFFVLLAGATFLTQLRYGTTLWWATGASPPPGYEQSLPLVYLAWLGTVALLYPLCRWYDGLKGRRRDWWLRYL